MEENKEKVLVKKSSKGKGTLLSLNAYYSIIKRYEKFYKITWNLFDIKEEAENKRRSRLAGRKEKFEDECMKIFLYTGAPQDKAERFFIAF